ncbi:putative acetyl-coenzyme A carboxylase carboxyl transferase subunit beta [Arthrobacter sp. Hiyo4]|nr:putative acetyl-coenzyme A carboxylase carboxyl transferase subunit beta [Arthrobacter sp. Hiyo4]
MHRTTDFAAQLADAQGVNVAALYTNGLVDHIVDERDDASLEPREFCARMARAIEYELGSLAGVPVSELLAARSREVPGARRVGARVRAAERPRQGPSFRWD